MQIWIWNWLQQWLQGNITFNENSSLKFWKFYVPNGMVHSGCTDLTQATARLGIVLVSRIQKSGTGGDTILSNGKGHFGPTNWNDQTGQSGPPSKLVPSIPVGWNQNGWFHLMHQLKFLEFWVEWKEPRDSLMECWGVNMTWLDCDFHCFTI